MPLLPAKARPCKGHLRVHKLATVYGMRVEAVCNPIYVTRSTGDDWVRITWNGMRGGGNASVLFFIAWVIIGNFILLTLFLAILITSFQVRLCRCVRVGRASVVA